MSPGRKLSALGLLVAMSMVATELFTRHTVRTTLPRQVLARYQPSSENAPTPHTVFLGSSLTDAGVDAALLDSLKGAGPEPRHFNLALAGMKGETFYRLIFENHILPRGKPHRLVLEAGFFPYAPAQNPFEWEGHGERVNLIISELMTWEDLIRLRGPRIPLTEKLRFIGHKNWYGYHYRLEAQARVKEKVRNLFAGLMKGDSPGSVGNTGESGTDVAANPFGMAAGAHETFTQWAREALQARSQGYVPESALRSRDAGLLEMAALAREAGVELWMLRLPCPPSDSVFKGSVVFENHMRVFRTLSDSLGIRYLDLSQPPPGKIYTYTDGIHLDAQGRRALTMTLHRAWN